MPEKSGWADGNLSGAVNEMGKDAWAERAEQERRELAPTLLLRYCVSLMAFPVSS